ncbi:MAG: RedB protein [Actinomycetota bacterium]
MQREWTDTTGSRIHDQRRSRRSVRWTFIAGVLVWLVAIGAGMGMLWRHSITPGEAGQAPTGWPANSALRLAAGRYSLLMWCHPHCPCTRASLAELARLKALCGDRLAVTIVFEKPEGYAAEWVRGENWRLASAMPGCNVQVEDGGEAARFGARTSGQTLIFDQDGRLRFSGGLTLGRGHLGENPGFEGARRLVLTGSAPLHEAPVFGCALFTDGSEQRVPPARSGRGGSGSEGQAP